MQPEQRVTAFITDYAEQHARVLPVFAQEGEENFNAGFNEWQKACSELSQAHGTGAFELSGTSFAPEADHSPDGERVDTVVVDGDTAVVSTTRDASPSHIEYRLARHGDDDWRIDQLSAFYDDPDSPAVAEDVAARALASAEEEFVALPLGDQDRLDPSQVFTEGSFVDAADADDEFDEDDEFAIVVERIGTITVGGVLAVGDLGFELEDFGVLRPRVPAGEYDVEISSAFGQIAGLRVLFSDDDVASWHPAASAGGYIWGVAAGNLAVVDWEQASQMTVRDKESLWAQFADTEDGTVGLLTAPDSDVAYGVVCDSGWGDGAYPSYWGLGADGRPAQLLLDFGVIPGAPWADSDDDLDAFDDDDDDVYNLDRSGLDDGDRGPAN